MTITRRHCLQSQAELVIRLAGPCGCSAADARPLVANGLRIRSCSGLAAGLPCEAEVWDLSNLLVAGRPVQRQTVVAYLNSIYKAISDSIFEEQTDLCRTATGLYELLAFADAVDTEPGILLSCLSLLEDPGLVIRACMGEQLVQLSTDGQSYVFEGMQLTCVTAANIVDMGLPAGNSREQQQLSMQVAEQLEPLLYLAHSLQLQPLIRRLHCFISSNADASTGNTILYGVLSLVFTDRVLEAALGPSATGDTREAWISSVLTQRCGFVPGTSWCQQVLKPLRLSARPIEFEAVLQQDWQGSQKGDRVQVALDLFDSSTVKIGCTSWTAQLLLGPAISDGAAYRRLMSSKLSGV